MMFCDEIAVDFEIVFSGDGGKFLDEAACLFNPQRISERQPQPAELTGQNSLDKQSFFDESLDDEPEGISQRQPLPVDMTHQDLPDGDELLDEVAFLGSSQGIPETPPSPVQSVNIFSSPSESDQGQGDQKRFFDEFIGKLQSITDKWPLPLERTLQNPEEEKFPGKPSSVEDPQKIFETHPRPSDLTRLRRSAVEGVMKTAPQPCCTSNPRCAEELEGLVTALEDLYNNESMRELRSLQRSLQNLKRTASRLNFNCNQTLNT